MADDTVRWRGTVLRVHDNGDGTYSLETHGSGGTLPTGAATSANQTTGNNSLSSIDATLTGVSKAEDAAHASGDKGVMALAVRKDTAAAVAADGDYIPFIVDSLGRLHVAVGAIAAGEAHVGQVGGHTALASVTFSLDTSAYASGDLIAETQAVAGAFRVTDGTGVLASVTLNDKDDQGVALYIVILDANVSLGTENAAPSISDANADSILGIVAVATSDWIDLGGCKVANIRGINLPVKAASGTTSLYIGLVNSTGTPTFTASGVTARLGILQD